MLTSQCGPLAFRLRKLLFKTTQPVSTPEGQLLNGREYGGTKHEADGAFYDHLVYDGHTKQAEEGYRPAKGAMRLLLHKVGAGIIVLVEAFDVYL